MRTVLFLDGKCGRPYDPEVLATEGLGGTEASVIRVAEALAGRFRVYVAQHNRTTPRVSEAGVGYIALAHLPAVERPDVVVVVRSRVLLPGLRERYPRARRAIWFTNWQDGRYPFRRRLFLRRWIAHSGATVVLASRAHLANFRHAVRGAPLERWLPWAAPPLRYVYPPVADDLKPDSTPRDRNKLIYFSRPGPGLDQVLTTFSRLLRSMPTLRLFVANPGYLCRQGPLPEGAVDLGVLSHSAVLAHVRTALCTFYPQSCTPEAFGLVFTESNAVGTPVLAHPHGAAEEVLSAEQLVDARDFESVAGRLRAWHTEGAPVPVLRGEFRLARVVGEWVRFIEACG